MKKFDTRYFNEHDFSKEQIKKNFDNALKDLRIAKEDTILEVKFNYAYNAFIKSGIALLSFYKVRIKSIPGHHVKIINGMAEILNDDTIIELGNLMRSKRNMDFLWGRHRSYRERVCGVYNIFRKGVIESKRFYI